MTAESAALLIECQFALGLSQKQLGALVGRDKRTIQRWQEKGFILMPGQAQALADALQPVRPDLAEKVLEMGRRGALQAGLTPPYAPATAEVIDALLKAAADAGGATKEAIRPVVTAAFVKAEEAGVEVKAVVAGLNSRGP